MLEFDNEKVIQILMQIFVGGGWLAGITALIEAIRRRRTGLVENKVNLDILNQNIINRLERLVETLDKELAQESEKLNSTKEDLQSANLEKEVLQTKLDNYIKKVSQLEEEVKHLSSLLEIGTDESKLNSIE